MDQVKNSRQTPDRCIGGISLKDCHLTELCFFAQGERDGTTVLVASLGNAVVRPSLYWQPLPTEGEVVPCYVKLNRDGTAGVAYPQQGCRPRQIIAKLTFRLDGRDRPISRYLGRIVLGDRAKPPIGQLLICELQEHGTACSVSRFKVLPASTAPEALPPMPTSPPKCRDQATATIGEMLAAKTVATDSPTPAASIDTIVQKMNVPQQRNDALTSSTQQTTEHVTTSLPPNMLKYYRRQLAAAERAGNEPLAAEIRRKLGLTD